MTELAGSVGTLEVGDGYSLWRVPFPGHWLIVDESAADWLTPLVTSALERRTGWLAEHADGTELGGDDALDWEQWVQAEIVSAVREAVDDNEACVILIGVDVIGPVGATVVSTVIVESLDAELARSSELDELEPDTAFEVARDSHERGSLTIDGVFGRERGECTFASGIWTMNEGRSSTALRLTQRSVGLGADVLLGVGNGMAESTQCSVQVPAE